MRPIVELPQIEPEVVERADAARNRERILCTARRLFTERGASCVSMDELAEAAGVGKGTLFRRFGSRAALARAVLDEQERHLQEAFIRGDPPLGPGATAQERLVAFGEAWLDLLALHAELLPQQKAKYRGELFAASWPADAKRRYREFFQYDRDDRILDRHFVEAELVGHGEELRFGRPEQADPRHRPGIVT